MRILSANDIRHIEYEVLCELDRVCRDQGLNYFLAYGTLIGALRHRGFIPWDDDIDVVMPRADYEHLYRLSKAGAFSGHIKLVSHRDKSSIYPFFKLVDTRTRVLESFTHESYALGLWVDIFPLEKIDSSSPQMRRVAARARRTVWARHFAATDPHLARSTRDRMIKHLIYPVTRLINPWAVSSKADWIAYRSNEPCEKVTPDTRYVLLVDDEMKRNIFRPDELFPPRFADFEGRKFPIPSQAEEILRRYYGDWDRVPPEEERPPSHLREVTWVG